MTIKELVEAIAGRLARLVAEKWTGTLILEINFSGGGFRKVDIGTRETLKNA